MGNAIKMLVHVHAFYAEQVAEMLSRLSAVSSECRMDVHVTSPVEVADEIKPLVTAGFPSAKFTEVPNLGYDIAPFIEVLRKAGPSNYDLVLKLHTKRRSLSAPLTRLNGRFLSDDLWCDTLVHSLIGSMGIFKRNLAIFASDGRIGMAGSRYCVVKSDFGEDAVNATLLKCGLPHAEDFRFVAGSMFMARASLLEPLLAGDLGDFVAPVENDRRFTLAHILERTFGAMISAQDMMVFGLQEPPYIQRFMKIFFIRAWRFAAKLLRGVRA